MTNVDIAFVILEPNAPIPIFYKFIVFQMIFDVKMDISRTCRLVAGGHMMNQPTIV